MDVTLKNDTGKIHVIAHHTKKTTPVPNKGIMYTTNNYTLFSLAKSCMGLYKSMYLPLHTGHPLSKLLISPSFYAFSRAMLLQISFGSGSDRKYMLRALSPINNEINK